MAQIYIETFGCQMNEADSRYVAERALAAGYTIAARAEDANVLVLNTCTVRDNAERRAYGRIAHFKALKTADPAVKLAVCGCLAEQDRATMADLMPHIDGVFGTSELARLGDAIAGWREAFADDDALEPRYLREMLGGAADCVDDAFSHLRAFVTVQRGCSYYCTFCIVPHVRGRFDHRPAAEILADVAAHVGRGAREVMLVGQTVNAYRDAATGIDFLELLRRAAATDGLERLTFVTSHPKDLSPRIIAGFAAIPKLNPRLHLAMQSGSNRVLRRMNRKYTIEHFLELADAMRRHAPDWAFTTDLIAGFPSETGEEFEATLEIVERGIFAQAYSFVYSPRRGTPAALWEQVPPQVAAERHRRLAAAQDRACRAYHDRKVGSVVRALAQGPSRKDPAKLAAKTLDNVTVIAPRPPGFSDRDLAANPWVDVLVESAWVWGCGGSIRAVAARFDEPGKPVPAATIDLIAV